MPRPISEQVVVVTGASSGIGRETALRFARQGARVVLVARNQEALREVEREIRDAGGSALVVPADVSDFNQLNQAARQAVDTYGRIDTWVNNAAVVVYGTFEQIPIDQFRRVVDVNLMGQVHGARAALPHLKAAGGGTLIGIGSTFSEVPMPLQSAYVATKHALKGFYDTLRLEQEHERSGVQVSFVMPASVDTPLFDHAISHLGVKPGPVPPVYEPGLVADAVLHAAQHPVRDMVVGGGGAALTTLERVWPRAGDAVIRQMAFTQQQSDVPEPPTGPNNLWQPVPGKGSIHGGYRTMPFDPYSWVRLHPAAGSAIAGLALLGLAIPLAGLLRDRR